MPLQATSGAASYDAFGGGVPVVPNYIEDVFSTYLYTGNATTGQSINNGIDLATKGGLLWCKNRTTGSTPHYLFDTARDFSYSHAAVLNTASTAAQEDKGTDYAKPETNGFSFGSGAGSTSPNKSGDAFASWTFRKQPKFFDVLTYTGTGASSLTVNHNLGSTPGCIIVKNTSAGNSWWTYHRSLTNATNSYLKLNLTTAESDQGSPMWNPTSTTFDANDTNFGLNISGNVYVAYLFAHDAGGFGLTGTDNVISCGSCVSDASGYIQPVNLGYEPQWVMLKRTNSAANWVMMDTMRGMANTAAAASPILLANTSAAEAATGVQVNPTATGFEDLNWGGWGASNTYIYIAIRRGPMKVPTDATKVFNAVLRTGTGSVTSLTSLSFPPDMLMARKPSPANTWNFIVDRLRGYSPSLTTQVTDAEQADTLLTAFGIRGVTYDGTASGINQSGQSYINYFMGRAPSFMDVVCYTGTGSATTFNHNLAVVPELIIFKRRSAANPWMVYCNRYNGGVNANQYYQVLNATDSENSGSGLLNNTNPTSSVFTVGTWNENNASGSTYVAYLFATCAGVSKVFSYTGNGSSQTINCGFTSGARFVLIKRTDSTGDWYVWDSARGIVSGNDPHISLNTTAAEVTTDDTIDTDSTGFVVNQVSATNVNVSSATYIGLAIA